MLLTEEHIIGVHTDDLHCNYCNWIPAWKSHLEGLPMDVKVPPAAMAISSPLVASNWRRLLSDHPNRPLVDFFINGVVEGFRIGFKQQSEPLQSAKRNLSCALQHPDIVKSYLTKEASAGRVAGPFPRSSVPHAHVSWFGVIPKNHQPNKWRLIVDLSHPTNGSVNSGIPKELCSLKYITVDSAIEQIRQIGHRTLLAKIDIESAFRLLPIDPADRHLLSMKWDQHIFIDTCLPFGLRSAPKLFNVLADLLSWILEQHHVSPILHYLDDFLTMGPQHSPTCANNLTVIKEICALLGIPLALEKIEGPSHCLTFLGITLDTQSMQARQTATHPKPGGSLVIPQKSHEKRDTVPGRPAAACHQGGNPWKDICFQNVECSSSSQEIIPLHPSHKRLPLRPAMVAPLCHTLEWPELVRLLSAGPQNFHRCFRTLGLRCNLWDSVDAVGLVK